MFITLMAVQFTAPIKRLSTVCILTRVSLARRVLLPTLEGKALLLGAAVDTIGQLQRQTITRHIFPVIYVKTKR